MIRFTFLSCAAPALMSVIIMLAPDAGAASDPAMQMHDMPGMEGMENMPGMSHHRATTPNPPHATRPAMAGRHGHHPAGDSVAPAPATGPLGMPEAVRER